MKTRYRFSHRSDDGKTYYWQAARPIAIDSSLTEHVQCDVEWFWNPNGREAGK